MQVLSDIAHVQALCRDMARSGAVVGFVPTMGALHQGHLTLIRRCRAESTRTVVSIFVNPLQFGPQEDLAAYPRQRERDLELCDDEGVDLVFAPTSEIMYPPGFVTSVEVCGLTEGLCGRFRPGHFRGVTTVVAKLLNIVSPHRCYLGEKDYQQYIVLKRMAADLNLPVEIVPVPTVREADGLALSSRNAYLSPEQRSAAPALHRALQEGARAARNGASGEQVEAVVAQALAREPVFTLQYVEAVDPETLTRRGVQGLPMVIAAAAYLGATRLIDNVKVE